MGTGTGGSPVMECSRSTSILHIESSRTRVMSSTILRSLRALELLVITILTYTAKKLCGPYVSPQNGLESGSCGA